MMAINLMFNRFYKSRETAIDSADFVLFRKCFPNSPYVQFISRYFAKEEESKEVPPYTFALYNKASQSLEKNGLKRYNLGGYHYFATNSIGNSLSELLKENTVGIPRYILFNENGNVVDENAPKPFEKEKLYSEIMNKLKR